MAKNQNILIRDEIEGMLEQCKQYLKAMPTNNPQVRLIVFNFQERLNGLLDIMNTEEKQQDNPLSPREFEILGHVANGFTNREIASALRISCKTIEYHLSSVFQKLDASTRTEAVTIAIKKGILK